MSDFYKSFQATPYTVLGLRLNDLSLGAIIALHNIESPFVRSGIPTITDLMAGVFVCTRPFQQAMDEMESPEFPKLIKKWSKQLGKFDFSAAVILFAQYLKEGREAPTYDYDAQGTFSVPTAGEEVILNYLLMHSTLTESEILNDSFARRVRNYIVIKAMRGEVRLGDDQAIADAIKAGEEAAAAIEKMEGK